ncbi:hypothetical protein L218DRAFT_829609, partial [Marasmius fiardii PR-910]
VTDVLEGIHQALNCQITNVDWGKLNKREQDRVARAYEWRCSRSGRVQAVRNEGVKRVDYLSGRTKFRG